MKPELLEQKIYQMRDKIDYVHREYTACVQLRLHGLSGIYLRWLTELLNRQGELIASLYSMQLQQHRALARILHALDISFVYREGKIFIGPVCCCN